MKTQPKPIIVKKSIKHEFDPDEIAALNVDFGNAYDAAGVVEAEFDQIKSAYKAKLQEAESHMITIRARINAGFEFQDTEVQVVFRPADKKKDFYLLAGPIEEQAPVATEDMTPQDFQQDLIQAESVFSNKRELLLWLAGNDTGYLIVGQLGNKWYSALRCNVGAVKIEERLDSEQKALKTRHGAILMATDRALDWLTSNLGTDTAKGFIEGIQKILDAEKDKVE